MHGNVSTELKITQTLNT